MKSKIRLILLAFTVLLFAGACYAQEQLNITTYYPSPNGEYQNLHATNNMLVGVGATNPLYSLSIFGNVRVQGNIDYTGVITDLVPSDMRLKDITGNYEYGLHEISQIKTVRFNYKKDNPRGLDSNQKHTGVIAQEIQKIIPDAVSEAKDGYLELDTTPITWAMLNAIKELKKENEILKARIDALEAAH